jgi:hypothetical protein
LVQQLVEGTIEESEALTKFGASKAEFLEYLTGGYVNFTDFAAAVKASGLEEGGSVG